MLRDTMPDGPVGAALPPALRTGVPGPQSRQWSSRLAAHECPAVIALRARRAAEHDVEDAGPIVWRRALGVNVEDVDGNIFVDLTSAFGVVAAGHANPAVTGPAAQRLRELPHAMGDIFPDTGRVELLERLAQLTGLERGIMGTSGSDAVETALKTACIATGRDKVVSFHGGYHGLSYGGLSVLSYRHELFAAPFQSQLASIIQRYPYGALPDSLTDVAAVVAEPIQGRGGIHVAPDGWLRELRARCDRDGALLVLDEIYTGFGRTGEWFAFQHDAVRPDLLCLGKGLASGFPISVCMGTSEAMDAWGVKSGDATHTQTFLGNPVGCAMALANLAFLEKGRWVEQSRATGEWLAGELARFGPVRGRGLLLGVEIPDAPSVSRALLHRGWIVLPAGEHADVLAVVPPLITERPLLEAFLSNLAELL